MNLFKTLNQTLYEVTNMMWCEKQIMWSQTPKLIYNNIYMMTCSGKMACELEKVNVAQC